MTLNLFNTNGFRLGADSNGRGTNISGDTQVSWTFREQPKFFDVVTWSGTGSGITINHNLGSTPGMIILKKLSGPSGTGNWGVWHRGLPTSPGSQQYESNVFLNLTDQSDAYGYLTAAPTSTTFSIKNDFSQSSCEYVAYLFAHDAGGFGAAGTDNVISCGSFTTDGSGNATVSLGYEPQYVLVKSAQEAGSWVILDSMRGWTVPGNDSILIADASNAENTGVNRGNPTATGFQVNGFTGSAGTVIYMAIRRDPMKTPTSGTSVFSPITSSDTTGTTQTTGFPIDLQVAKYRAFTYTAIWSDRLRGVITTPTDANSPTLESANTTAEASPYVATRYFNNTGFQTPTGWSGSSVAFWNFRRAPGFFDIVCYTGTGSARTVTHNLGVAPEMMIIKRRDSAANWEVYHSGVQSTPASSADYAIQLNLTNAAAISTIWQNGTPPTSSVFSISSGTTVNASSGTYVAYLFATVAGVSKVGSYAGTGGTQTINCGFTGGARFVLIKRTDSTGYTTT